MSRAFGPAYARGEAGSEALLPAAHRDAASRRAIVARAAARGLPGPVRAALVAQNPPASGSARRASLDLLDAPNLSVVVTGQQVGLFAGPLYCLWKAATAIAWAGRLQRECGTPVLPIFWLQTEDHDLAEIAAATVTDAHGGVHTTRLEPATERAEHARVAIAHRRLGDEVEEAIARVAALLHEHPFAGDAVAELKRHYRPGASWSDAFAGLFGTAFAETPLLTLQPRTPELARLAAPVHAWALEQHERVAVALSERGRELVEAGFGEQVPHRSDCALSFFHVGGAEGPRFRLRRTDEGWALADGTDRPVGAEVARALEGEPLRFSTSALLRPLVQDTLLPTAAYVGGPGEVAYWAQLPPLYELAELPMPMVIPRASGVFVDAATRSDLSALGVAARDASCDARALLERLGPSADTSEFEGLAARVRALVEATLTPARARARKLPGNLDAAFDRTVDNAARGAEKLEQRLCDAALWSDPERAERARRVTARLRPGGTPQDRSLCWPDLAARFGIHSPGPSLVAAVSAAVESGDESTPLEIEA